MIVQHLNTPSCYADWLEWFKLLQRKSISREEWKLLKNGRCKDIHSTIEYFEHQLIQTENIMIKRYLKEFAKSMNIYLSYGEYERLYQPFRILAKQFAICLFFSDLSFLSLEFRKELRDSVIANATDHWNKAVKNLYTAYIESNSDVLEDQLYMIKKIRLFQNRENRYE